MYYFYMAFKNFYIRKFLLSVKCKKNQMSFFSATLYCHFYIQLLHHYGEYPFLCTTFNMDVRGRRRKVSRQRLNPLLYFDEHDFQARYRLSKHVVQQLSARFANSPFLTTLGEIARSQTNKQDNPLYNVYRQICLLMQQHLKYMSDVLAMCMNDFLKTVMNK